MNRQNEQTGSYYELDQIEDETAHSPMAHSRLWPQGCPRNATLETTRPMTQARTADNGVGQRRQTGDSHTDAAIQKGERHHV